MSINAKGITHKELNRAIAASKDVEVVIENCLGHRFIAGGMKEKNIAIYGIPGNALGAYLDGAKISVYANAQDAVGDTMNKGRIIIHGSSGDATGYAMRGGSIFVKGNVGYRAGIHMKSYKNKNPLLIIGGCAGSFLGEYQAGGTIIVLNLSEENYPVGSFCATGMYGGKIVIRSRKKLPKFPKQVTVKKIGKGGLGEIEKDIREYAKVFGLSYKQIMDSEFYVLTPNEENPYEQRYVSW